VWTAISTGAVRSDEAAIADIPAARGAIRDIMLGHLDGIYAVVHRVALPKTRWTWI
jgi:hypothetical protein